MFKSVGLVSVIVLPKGGAPLSLALRNQVREYLDERRLVTTRIFVVETAFVAVDIGVVVAKTAEANPVELEARVREVIQEFYHSEYGGNSSMAVGYVLDESSERGSGWSFGRNIYRSELFELLERIDGVDHVEEITTPSDTILIEDYQLPALQGVSVVVAA